MVSYRPWIYWAAYTAARLGRHVRGGGTVIETNAADRFRRESCVLDGAPAIVAGLSIVDRARHDTVDIPLFSPVSTTNPVGWSTGEDSRLKNLQAVGDILKDIAKKSRRISGTARDVLDVVQRELQRETSLDFGEW
jgi:hypothetical protein